MEYENNDVDLDKIKYLYFDRLKNSYTPDLPVKEVKQSLIKSIDSYRVFIMTGETGTGKSTQVPFYVLEDAIVNRSQKACIFVTQPRRIAAQTLARRVCQEHEWQLGSIVGYQIGLDRVIGPDTMLTFCTSGVLLQRIIIEKSLDRYSHIIIDEAHERDADTDLLLMAIRKHMIQQKSFFRLIIMSATINKQQYVDYFTLKLPYGHSAALTPVSSKIPAKNPLHKITVHYLEEYHDYTQSLLGLFDRDKTPELPQELLEVAVKLVTEIIPKTKTMEEYRSILVFLPGLVDIISLNNMLSKASDCLEIVPLHSCLSNEEHALAFKSASPGKTKVILSTNIAESSITVRDIAFVIDFCLTKVLKKDSHTNFPCLSLIWASKDQAIQRAGRTGRCCPGTVYRMLPKNFYDKLDEYATPELLMAPLELSVLKVKRLEMGDIKELLGSVLDKPALQDIMSAVLELKQIGALTCTYKDELCLVDGDITSLGRILSELPIDVHLSKLIVYGYVFGVMDDTISIASCLSTNRGIVKYIFGNDVQSYKNKLNWAAGSNSDSIAILTVFKEYKTMLSSGKNQSFIRNWCWNLSLDDRRMNEAMHLEREIKFRLETRGILSFKSSKPEGHDDCHDELFLKIALTAAFYPNYFRSKEIDSSVIKRDLLGQDSRRSLHIENFPHEAVIYHEQIRNQISQISPDFKYITYMTRAVIRFDKDEVSQKDDNFQATLGVDGLVEGTGHGIIEDIYLVLKMFRQTYLQVRCYEHEAAQKRVEYYHQLANYVMGGNDYIPSAILVNHEETSDAENHDPLILSMQAYVEVPCNKELDDADNDELTRVLEIEAQQDDGIYEPSELYQTNYQTLRPISSPILLEFDALLERLRPNSVQIDKNSVNCVLLDPDYDLGCSQMLVAGSVSKFEEKSKLMIRHTTLMPRIRGLPALLALLFAPNYQYRNNTRLNCLAGASFGLGWNVNGQSIHRPSELDLTFDALFSLEDIVKIGECRKTISETVAQMHSTDPSKPLVKNQITIRESILHLVRKRRFPMPEISISNLATESKESKFDDSILTQVALPGGSHNIGLIYKTIKLNLEDLMAYYRREKTRISVGGMSCYLCYGGYGKRMFSYGIVSEHIESEEHKKRVGLFNSDLWWK